MVTTLPTLSRAPRAIPLSTRLVVLLGAPLAAMGWFFFAFGMVFTWVFVGNADWSSPLFFRGELQRTRATVSYSEKTSFSEGGGKGRKGTPIYAYHYQFTFNGTEYKGTSYRTGGTAESERQAAMVEFPKGRPERSRLLGMRRAPMHAFAAIVVVFPIAGVAMLLPSLTKGRRDNWLLAHGELTQGRLIAKEPTNVTVNKQRVHKLTFEFTDAFGEKRTATAKTHLTERLQDDQMELILHQTHRPFRATLVDNLPGKQSFTPDGAVRPNSFWPVFRALIGPVLALLVVAGGLVMKMLL